MKSLGRIGTLILSGAIVLAGCSSSQTKDGDSGDDVIPSVADAGTDAVPAPSDSAAPPADGSSPPADGSAPPAGDPSATPPAPDASAAVPGGAPPTDLSAAGAPPTTPDAAPPAAPDAGAVPPAADATAAAAPPAAAAPAAAEMASSASPSSSGGADASSSSGSSSGSGSSLGGATDTYTVKKGDTLMKIAFELYGDLYKWKQIYESNKEKISNPNHISSGLLLNVEKSDFHGAEGSGEKYLIKKGDTLGKISDALYGTPGKWKVLWENNKQLIHDPNRIFAGFYLYYTPDANHHGHGDDATAEAASDRNPSSQPAGEAGAGAASSAQAAPAGAAPAPATPEAGGAPVSGESPLAPATDAAPPGGEAPAAQAP